MTNALQDLNKGYALLQSGDFKQAAATLRRAVAALPKHHLALHLLGLAEAEVGNMEDAQKAMRASLAAQPPQANFFENYCALLLKMESFAEALEVCERAIQIDPRRLQFRYFRAVILAKLGRLDKSLTEYDHILNANPHEPVWLGEKGAILSQMKRHDEAIECLRLALSGHPENSQIRFNFARALQEAGKYAEAIAAYDTTLSRSPDFADAEFNRGAALRALGRNGEALECFDAVLRLQPERMDALISRANALQDLGRMEEAIAAFDKAVASAPDFAPARHARSVALHEALRIDEALAEADNAIQLSPDYHDAHVNRGMMRLLKGEFASGWTDYESRLCASDITDRNIIAWRERCTVRPTRHDFEGRRVLLLDEQGPGDTIMFTSILPDLAACAASVDFVVQPRLQGFLTRAFPGVQLHNWDTFDEAAIDYDTVVFTGSLGHAFRRTLEDFSKAPYLRADDSRVADWSARLPSSPFRIGVSWKGGTPRTRRHLRSIEPGILAPLVRSLPSCEFICLQYDATDADFAAFAGAAGRKLVVYPPHQTNDFDDLAALVGALDAVVTVQNTNVHLCGALGVPCFAVLPELPEWRYGLHGSSMPWYQSVELSRREADQDVQLILAKIVERISAIPLSRDDR